MAEYRSSLTAQQIEDSLLKSFNTQATPAKIDEAVTFYKDSLSPVHITHFDSSVSARIDLTRSFTLDTDGDYVEFTIKMNDMDSAYAGTLGIVGSNDGDTNNCIGYLSNTDFRMRGNEATWLIFGNPGVDPTAWNTYKVQNILGTHYRLYVNGSQIGSDQAITQPIIINNLARAYYTGYVAMDAKYFKVRKGNDVIEAYDFMGNGDMTKYNITETIVPGVNLNNTSLLKVRFSYNKIEISKPQSNGDYVKYTVERYVNTDDTSTGGQSNADNWRIKLCDHYDENGNIVQAITSQGNWETAIKISGADDFMGGSAHGDEVLTHFVVLIDGTKVDHTQDSEYQCFQIELVQASELTVPPNGANAGQVCADSYKRWRFHGKRPNEFWQRIKWRLSQSLTDSYLWMIPIKRKVNSDDTGDQITDTFMTGPLYQEVSIANANHNAPHYYGDDSNGDVMTFSQVSGYSCRTTFKKGWDAPNRDFFVSGSNSYNKNYFDCSGNITTTVGQVQEIEVEFDVNYRGN